MKIITKIVLFFNAFLIFNLPNIDSDMDKSINYNRYNLYDKEYRNIYFKNLNSKNFYKVTNLKNIIIYSYVVEDKTYYAKNINELIDYYTKDMSQERKVYYKINGIKIDGINVMCNNKDLLELEKVISIY